MKKFFQFPNDMTPQARSAFLFTTLLGVGHAIAVPYYLYLMRQGAAVQFSVLAAITTVLALVLAVGAVLSWRGKPVPGTVLVLSSLAAAYPPFSAIVSGMGLVLGPTLMIVGAMSALQVLPRRSGQVMASITAVSGVGTLLLDIFGASTRPALPGPVIPLLALLVVGMMAFFIVREFQRIRTSVSYKLIFVVVAVLGLIAVFQIAFSNWETEKNLKNEDRDVMVSFNEAYQTRINTQRLAAEALALSIADRQDIQAAYLSGNREELYNLLAPLFTQWQDREIVHLYIENPDGTVFLRVHNPEKFGDDIKYRGTANTALNEKRVTSGVEIGSSRLGVRGVAPMYAPDGTFIGLAEVGMDFDDQFISDLKATTGADYTMWVLRDAAAVANLQPVAGSPSAPIEETFYYASTNNGAVLVDPEIYRSVLKTGTPAFEHRTWNTSNPSIVYVTPLLGYQDKVIGLLQISSSYADHIAAQKATLRTTLGVIAGLTILGIFLIGLLSTRLIVQPLNLLYEFAVQQINGKTDARVSVTSGDEFQQLAETFNSLADSVQHERSTLEERVAERTQNLEVAAQVGRAVSQVRSLDALLTDAAELIRKQFNLYYVQVYLANPSRTYLNLEAGTGQVGQQLLERNHRLPFTVDSINGRAAVEKQPVVIADTTISSTFKPNPLLPDTRSEMAVPLMIGDRVVGVLDMQSRYADALSMDVLPAFEALAGQLAIAIQNANFLAEAEQARAEVEAQAKRQARANWTDYLDAIHKPEETGFAFEQNKIVPLREEAELPDNALVKPITVSGEALGNLVVEMEGQSPIARTDELIETVARQVSQQIESLRLLDSAERYRLEVEEASRRLTREGWSAYTQASDSNLSYFYDLKEVLPYSSDALDLSEEVVDLPLKVRDEPIGKLVVQGVQPDDEEALALASAVAERLSAHIESLRQFDETKRGQAELDKRARQLAAVAEISSVSSRELDIQKMLESVVHLTQRKFGLYHAHVFVYNKQTDVLKIAACGWQEGDIHEGTHGSAEIPLTQEQSLVARSARTAAPVIVNDVHNEPGWLPNPLLPDTSSELAVPLIIGDKLLGVLDVQSDKLNAFTSEDASIFATLASQISTALQNAQSFVQAQQQAERESKLNMISQKIQSATTVEAVLQIAARELGHTLGAPLTIAQLGLKDNQNSNGKNHN